MGQNHSYGQIPTDEYERPDRTGISSGWYLCKMAIMGLTILALILLVLYGVSEMESCRTPQNGLLKDDSHLCLSEACVKAAGELRLSMDSTADPCEDFYQYTCGGWESNNKPRHDGDSVSWFQLRQDYLNLQIKELLDSIDPLDATLPTSVKHAVSFYTSCTANLKQAQPVQMAHVLDDIMTWPLTSETWKDTDFKWTDVVSRGLRLVADGAGVVRVTAKLNELDNSRYILTMSSGHWPYPKVMSDSGEVDWFVDRVLKTRTSHHDIMVDEMTALYARLQQIVPSNISPTDANQIKSNFRTLGEMTELTGVNWTSMVREATTSEYLVHLNITEDMEVFWEDVNYFVSLSKLLNKFPKRAVANVLGWNLLSTYTYNPSVLFSYPRNSRQLAHAALPTVDAFEQCLGLLTERYNYPLLHLLLLKRYPHLRDKSTVQGLVESVKKAFIDSIGESSWLDRKMKKRAEMKIKSLISRLGYPAWIIKGKSLDDFYKEATNLTYRYLEDLINNAKFMQVKNFQKLGQTNARKEWPMWVEAPSVNGVFSQLENMMVLPLAILTEPFLNKELPQYLNYGSLGVIVGHEMTHALDMNGRWRDPRGNLADWMNSASQDYDRVARCFIAQYSQYYYRDAKAFVNGTRTLNENLADAGGIRLAQRAYSSWEHRHGPEARLPTFANFTSDQMFFLRYGTNWCQSLGTSRLRQELRVNSHTIGKFRLNGALSNLPEFWQAFSCKPGSAMINDDVCSFW